MIKEFAEFHNISEEVSEYIIKDKNPICKCGRFKKIKPSSQSKVGLMLSIYCGNKECSPNFGRKRPEHSVLMKRMAAGEGSPAFLATLMKQGELFNREVNTIAFKRQVLTNKGFDVVDKSDEEIEELHSIFLGNLVRSREVREKTIMTKIQQWDDEFKTLGESLVDIKDITLEKLKTLTDEEFNEKYLKLHGIQTVINNINVQETRSEFFIRVLFEDLKYNSQGKTTVRTRSRLEAEYIKVFEQNGVPWSYEELRLITINKTGVYIPDFIIQYEGQTYIVEVKGNFYGVDKETYFAEKLMAAAEYAKGKGWKFCISFVTPKDMSFLNKATFL